MLYVIKDRDEPFGICARYRELLKPGDYIALTHLTWQYVSDLVPAPDWKPDSANYEPDLTDKARTFLVGGVGRLV